MEAAGKAPRESAMSGLGAGDHGSWSRHRHGERGRRPVELTREPPIGAFTAKLDALAGSAVSRDEIGAAQLASRRTRALGRTVSGGFHSHPRWYGWCPLAGKVRGVGRVWAFYQTSPASVTRRRAGQSSPGEFDAQLDAQMLVAAIRGEDGPDRRLRLSRRQPRGL